MTGELLIDGIDIRSEFGAYVTSGGWAALAAWPPLKKPDSNDWQEEDGVEPDLSAPVLDTRELTLTLAVRDTFPEGGDDRLAGLLDLLADGVYHDFAAMGRTYRLRLSSHPKLSFSRTLTTLSLKLHDDFPPELTDEGPSGGADPHGDWSLDGRDLAEYGVRVLSGTLSNVVRRPDVKEALKRDVAELGGVEYDGGAAVTLKSADAKLTCLMRARDLAGLWVNWHALLRDLTLPDVRTIGADALGQEYYAYYKSCSVSKLDFTGRPWLEFTLTMTVTDGFRDVILAAEDGTPVCTEDGESEFDMGGINRKTT